MSPGISLTNVSLVLTNGVALGNCNTSNGIGIKLEGGAKLISEGTPAQLNRLVGYRTVQESALSSAGGTSQTVSCAGGNSPTPEVRLRFTDLALLTDVGSSHISAPLAGPMLLSLSDCQLLSGRLSASSAQGLTLSVTNCLFMRVGAGLQGDNVVFYNNTFSGGAASFSGNSGQTYTIKDNLFDQTTVTNFGSGTWSLGNNGYISAFSRLTPNGPNDVILSASPVYDTGPLRSYYLPIGSLLINAGSRLASAASLYHETVRADQTKEAATQVDIGFHSVALNASGLPMDTDSDGLPDYLEDRNGNGVFDSASGETDWQTSNSAVSGAAAIQVFTPME